MVRGKDVFLGLMLEGMRLVVVIPSDCLFDNKAPRL